MNDNVLKDLYDVVEDRKKNPMEGSYTCYLFDKGIDKILKKVGEESSETIIAAKNGNNSETVCEISDLIYHLIVMMAQQGIPLEDVFSELENRSRKIGNLKQFHTNDKNS
ncbi:MAG: phosphoribosyl-ATP diphosphatase [Oscillospiraceae bacterium]|nr:phosphoribosyl-ATP diphosphatase [Oscillospiraceae bacterium]